MMVAKVHTIKIYLENFCTQAMLWRNYR